MTFTVLDPFPLRTENEGMLTIRMRSTHSAMARETAAARSESLLRIATMDYVF